MKRKTPRFKKIKPTPIKLGIGKKSKIGKKIIKPVSYKGGVRERRGTMLSRENIGFDLHGGGGYGIVRLPKYMEWSNKNKQGSPAKNVIGIEQTHWRKMEQTLLSKRVVVLLHIYYNDTQITQEILSGLTGLPFNIDLCVSLIKGNKGNPGTKKIIENSFPDVKFFEVRNRGKDIGGKLTMFKHLLLEKSDLGYDYMLLIHDKKSPHSTISGEGWRKTLLRGVLHRESIKNGFMIMETDNDIVGFGSSRWLRGGPLSLVSMIGPRTARVFIDKFLSKLGRKTPTHFGFVGGTMFWCRYHPMMSFWTVETLDTALKMLEAGDVREPSYTHAMERIFGMILTTFNRKTLLGV